VPARAEYYRAGATQRWELRGAPQRDRLLVLSQPRGSTKKSDTNEDREGGHTHNRLAAVVARVEAAMASPAFARWAQSLFVADGVAALAAEASRTVARRFRPGLSHFVSFSPTSPFFVLTRWIPPPFSSSSSSLSLSPSFLKKGLDYTMAGNPRGDFAAAASALEKTEYGDIDCILDATFCYVGKPGKAGASLFAGGDAGGYVCYMPQAGAVDGDPGQDPAVFIHEHAEISSETETETHNAAANVLTLTLRPRSKNILTFVKFVSDAAPSSRIDVRTQVAFSRPST
jgi:Oxoglutarate and iron-dependent oxygenase degradation C-term